VVVEQQDKDFQEETAEDHLKTLEVVEGDLEEWVQMEDQQEERVELEQHLQLQVLL
jgi:hypothetical protein